MNDIKLVILNSKQDTFPIQKVITILNQLQNLPKLEKEEKWVVAVAVAVVVLALARVVVRAAVVVLAVVQAVRQDVIVVV